MKEVRADKVHSNTVSKIEWYTLSNDNLLAIFLGHQGQVIEIAEYPREHYDNPTKMAHPIGDRYVSSYYREESP